jgi:hypothetical protein
MFTYDCPYCNSELEGSYGDDVYCEKCNKTYETDWDYTSYDSMSAWLTGNEVNGKVDYDYFMDLS